MLEKGHTPEALRDALVAGLKYWEGRHADAEKAHHLSRKSAVVEERMAPHLTFVGFSSTFAEYMRTGEVVRETKQQLAETNNLVEGFSQF